jgi:deazaflavin-dependent oxidoreductase (nitroreductase family)
VSRPGRLQQGLERYLFNPLMRSGLRLGVAPRAFALLETTGRRTGRTRLTPVGGAVDAEGSAYWLVAEHGTRCAYVQNLMAHPTVRVKLERRWRRGTASVVPDDEPFARRRAIDRQNGLVGRADGVFFRAAASTPVTVRVDLD